MELVLAIIMIALIQFTFFGIQVGMARMKYNVKAPAMSGDPTFERFQRVHLNTLEQLVTFVPAILAFSYMAERQGWAGYYIASGLGLVWIIGRFIYAKSYVKNPDSRAVGFMMTALPTLIMTLGTLLCVVLSFL